MSPAEAWWRLGIEPTDDKRAVRRAYADTLRAVDPGAEPAVFMALRDARDLALATGATPASDDAWDDDDAWSEWSDADETGNDEDAGTSVDGRVLEGWDGRSRASVFWGQPPLAVAETPTADTVFFRNPRTDEVPDRRTRDTPLLGETEGRGERHDETRPTPVVATRDDDVDEEPARVVFTPDPGTALYGLLAAQGSDAPLTATQLGEALGYLDAFARDAEQSTIERHAEIDEWIANLLARHTPRSDPLIAPAGKLFGWETRTNDLFLPSALDHLVARQKGLNFVRLISDPKHPLNRAWGELTQPATERTRRGWFVNRNDVRRLLDAVRRDHPFVEDEFFDERRVALWETKLGKKPGNWRPLWIGLIILVALARLLASIGEDERRSAEATASLAAHERMTDRAGDIDALLARLTLSERRPRYADLAGINLSLSSFLTKNWKTYADKGFARSDWFRGNEFILRSEIDRSDVLYSREVLAARRRFERDTARALLDHAPERCDIDLSNGPPADAHGDAAKQARLRTEYENWVALALREIDPLGRGSKDTATFTVPGPIVKNVIESSGLTEARVREALQRTGSRVDQCRVRIALIDAALEAPQSAGLPILRAM